MLDSQSYTFNTRTGYNWGGLPLGSVIVDVGGGVGSQTLPIASANLGLKCIVQDRGPVIAEGIKVCTFSPFSTY